MRFHSAFTRLSGSRNRGKRLKEKKLQPNRSPNPGEDQTSVNGDLTRKLNAPTIRSRAGD